MFFLGGWVHSVAFSPSGAKVGWVGHDSTVSILLGGEGAEPAVLPLTNLPFVTCVFVSESVLIAGGKFHCFYFGIPDINHFSKKK